MPTLTKEYKVAVYGACALLGLGGSTLLINSLAMISQMIGKNLVSIMDYRLIANPCDIVYGSGWV